MARTIFRHTLTVREQRLWETENMQGWREAMERYVEDEARDQGYMKYIIFDRKEKILAKDMVKALPQPEPVA